ncbi:MAG: DUF1116 domain-containing protein [Acidimicrobiia bacterium]
MVSAHVAPRRYLHAGPALDLSEASQALTGAFVAALLFEGEARDPAEALAIIRRGELEIVPCHDDHAVGALAGVVSPNTPVFVIERADGRRTFSPIHEGPGTSIRAGQFDPATLANLHWLSKVMGPMIADALRQASPIDPLEVLASGLGRGDEGHNRNVSCSADFFRRIAPAICEIAGASPDAATVLHVLADNVQFFLPMAMAAAKAVADDIHALAVPGLVTAVAANGTHFGIRVSGTSQGWFTTESPIGDLVFYDGFRADDVSPLVGDSPVVETIGLGAFALSAAPNLARSLERSVAEAKALVEQMRSICLSESPRFAIPSEEFRPTGFGIQVKSVVATGVTPAFSIGYLHRQLGRGRVGAGLLHAPIEPFEQAATALAETPPVEAR